VRSAVGRWVRRALESLLFEKIPGYRLAKAFAGEGPSSADDRPMRPALAAIEDGLCPALVMDEFADGRLLVFVPSSPAPMSGTIYIFTPDRVTVLDVPLLPFMKALSSWGLGLCEMIEGAKGRVVNEESTVGQLVGPTVSAREQQPLQRHSSPPITGSHP
jgi:hypothetical protein